MEKEFDEMPDPEEEFSEKYRGERRPFRMPASKELSLGEITGKEQTVAVTGTLISLNKTEMSGILSDESMQAQLTFTEGEQLLGLREGRVVRIIGKPAKKGKLSIEAEIVQELKGFDSNLYRKVRELEKKHYGDTK